MARMRFRKTRATRDQQQSQRPFPPWDLRRKVAQWSVRAVALAALGIAMMGALAPSVGAQQTNRIWVDATGRHSVEATLLRVTKDWKQVVLQRADGGTVTLTISRLSRKDRQFIDDHLGKAADPNRLRSEAPKAPDFEPLPVLELGSAIEDTSTHAPTHTLAISLDAAVRVQPLRELPEKLPADRSPWSIGCPESVISIDHLDFADEVSALIPIVVNDDWDTRSTSVALSVCGRPPLPGQPTRQQLLRFDFADQQSMVTMQHTGRIRLLDHHIGSGRSLVLVDYGIMGNGGTIALAEGWNSDNVKLLHQRSLPAGTPNPPGQITLGQPAPTLHWARMVDQQHVLALIKQNIVLWNIVSGETVYQIPQVDFHSQPALSGGRRYLAVPGNGTVDLYATDTGKPLGQIKVERSLPGVAFSPFGNSLAIVTSRRLRVWNLVNAALDADVTSRESYGKGNPTWIDHDLLLSSSGILVSQFRGLPLWKYDVSAAKVARVGKHIAILRKEPLSQLATMRLPHASVQTMLKRMDASAVKVDHDRWRIPGRSTWDGSDWIDRTLRLGGLPPKRR